MVGRGTDPPYQAALKSAFESELPASLRKRRRKRGKLSGTGLRPSARGFHTDERLFPPGVIASRSWAPAGEGLVQQFEIDDLVGIHAEPVGKTTTAFAGNLLSE